MPGASSLAGALAGFCGAPLADFVGAVDMLDKDLMKKRSRPCIGQPLPQHFGVLDQDLMKKGSRRP